MSRKRATKSAIATTTEEIDCGTCTWVYDPYVGLPYVTQPCNDSRCGCPAPPINGAGSVTYNCLQPGPGGPSGAGIVTVAVATVPITLAKTHTRIGLRVYDPPVDPKYNWTEYKFSTASISALFRLSPPSATKPPLPGPPAPTSNLTYDLALSQSGDPFAMDILSMFAPTPAPFVAAVEIGGKARYITVTAAVRLR